MCIVRSYQKRKKFDDITERKLLDVTVHGQRTSGALSSLEVALSFYRPGPTCMVPDGL